MENKMALKIIVLRQGWIASTLSDIQTFGFMVGGFALNSLYIGNNDWLNACLFFTFFLWAFSKAISKSKSKTVYTKQDAIQYVSEEFED